MREGFESFTDSRLSPEVGESLAAAAMAGVIEAPVQPPEVQRQVSKPRRPVNRAAGTSTTEPYWGGSGVDSIRLYLGDISRTALLEGRPAEVELSKRIEAGLYAEKILEFLSAGEIGREDIRQSILAGVRVRLKGKAARTERLPRPKSAEERRAATEKADLERERIVQQETMLSMAALQRLAADRRLSRRSLEALARDGKQAKDHMLRANLRLVTNLAKYYVGHGTPYLDIVQAGNLGLIRAVEKFDYTKGFKFNTYAAPWIRQAMGREVDDQMYLVHLPVRMVAAARKLNRVRRELEQSLDREPTSDELAGKLHTTPKKVEEVTYYTRSILSLNQVAANNEAGETLGDFGAANGTPETIDMIILRERNERLYALLGTLGAQEQRVIMMLYSIGYPSSKTLDEIGEEFKLPRERIQQIGHKAIGELRRPGHKRVLKDYLD